VVAGRYIKEAIARGLTPRDPDGALLESLAAAAGHPVTGADKLLAAALGVDEGLRAKTSAGSTNPDAVIVILDDLAAEDRSCRAGWAARRAVVTAAAEQTDTLLAACATDPR
jgi:argininosuccinate lyase